MLFKHLGASVAAASSKPDDDSQKIATLRFSETELNVYDVVAKSMGLTRQAYLQNLIRSSFHDSVIAFVQGYLEQNPSVSFAQYLISFAEDDETQSSIVLLLKKLETSLRIDSYAEEIEAMQEQEELEHPDGRYYLPKGFWGSKAK